MVSVILVINGPNLNLLGAGRDVALYGDKTLDGLVAEMAKRAAELGSETLCYQSNHEGELIDFIQQNAGAAKGVIVNPGGLTHAGFSLLDALIDTQLPFVEVHLSNVAAREAFRRRSIFSQYAVGTISGLKSFGYLYALDFLLSSAV